MNKPVIDLASGWQTGWQTVRSLFENIFTPGTDKAESIDTRNAIQRQNESINVLADRLHSLSSLRRSGSLDDYTSTQDITKHISSGTDSNLDGSESRIVSNNQIIDKLLTIVSETISTVKQLVENDEQEDSISNEDEVDSETSLGEALDETVTNVFEQQQEEDMRIEQRRQEEEAEAQRIADKKAEEAAEEERIAERRAEERRQDEAAEARRVAARKADEYRQEELARARRREEERSHNA